MTRRHFVLLIAYCLLIPIAASAASFAVGLWTDRWQLMIIVMALVMLPGMYFVLRWWLGVARSVGISTQIDWTPSRVTIALAYLGTMIGSVVLSYVAYAVTNNRFVECVLAIGISFPILLVLQRFANALAPRPKPQETAMLRFSFYMQLVLPFVFGSTLVSQLWPTRHDDGIGLREWIIPSYFVLIALFPMNALFIRKRYLQARAEAAAASAPV